jgi:hypothetical protein
LIDKWCAALHHADNCPDQTCACAQHARVLIHLTECLEFGCKKCNFLISIGDLFVCECKDYCPIATLLEDRRSRLFDIFEDLELMHTLELDFLKKRRRTDIVQVMEGGAHQEKG